MGSIKLPQAQYSELPPIRKPNSQDDLILQVLGNNPYAQGIASAGSSIANALAKRAELRREAQQVEKLEELTGQAPGSFSGLNLSTATPLASRIMAQKEDERKRQVENYTPEQLSAIETGVFSNISKAYPGGVPKDVLSLASTIQNRKALDLDRDEARRLRESEQGTRITDKEKARYRNYKLDMEQRDPIIKEINKQGLSLASLDSLLNLAKEGNTVAFSGVGIKMAKGMGEVGVMTEQDIKRYVTSRMLTQKAADTLSMWIKGRPSEATIGEIQEITNAMKTAFLEKAQPRYDQYINTYANIEGIPPEEFSKRLAVTYGGNGLSPIEPKKPSAITPSKIGRFTIKVK